MLPTLEEMNDRYPLIYNNHPCLKCNNETETTLHTFTCQENLINIRTSIIQILREILKEHTNPQKAEQILNKHIIKSNLLAIDKSRINSFETTPYSTFSIADTLRFLIPKSLTTTLTRTLKKTRTQLIPIIQKFTDRLTKELYTLWTKRNDRILIWESTQNITKTIKKQPRARNSPKQLSLYEIKSSTQKILKNIQNRFFNSILYNPSSSSFIFSSLSFIRDENGPTAVETF
jgi:hypothetical protein